MKASAKKIITAVLATILFALGFSASVYALPIEQSAAIQALLDDACRVSGVPGISISIIYKGETYYFSSGYAGRENDLAASESTLYELASVSKAFTAAGILLLEERGLLAMTDSIQKYLPWYQLTHRGQPVDMQSLTLNHFLHHTSGLTNGTHMSSIPQGGTPDMLKKTVEKSMDIGLSFKPGERYEYGTVNYDVLGLVIEAVSGQSYEEYMTGQVFRPLGLNSTYVFSADAEATGQLAKGYRTSFFITSPYDAPEFAGNKPAGYIISCASDMARWMNIHMGAISDIPEELKAVIGKSHQGDTSVEAVGGMYYAAGWMVNADATIIEHSGQNPNFASNVAILPEEQFALCLLSNGTNMNTRLAPSVKNILDGNLGQPYSMSVKQLIDVVLSSAAIIACILAAAFFLLGLSRKKRSGKQKHDRKRILLSAVWLVITIAALIICLVAPSLAGNDWTTTLVWQTYGVLAAPISLVLLFASITWFVYAKPAYTLLQTER